jgi:hypothetical protein
VQRILRHTRAGLVQKLHEGNVLLRRDETHFVQIWVSARKLENKSRKNDGARTVKTERRAGLS